MHFRFKAKIKEIKGSRVVLETFEYKEAERERGSSKLQTMHEGPYVEEPIDIPLFLIGRKIRCLL